MKIQIINLINLSFILFGLLVNAQDFTPAAYSPALWLDVSDEATIIHSSGNVSAWNDKSGNGNHTTQSSSSNQPNFISVSEGIDFNGSSDVLIGNNLGYGSDKTITLFVVAQPDPGSDRGSVIAKGSLGSVNDYRIDLGEKGFGYTIQDQNFGRTNGNWNIAHKNLAYSYYNEEDKVAYYLNGSVEYPPNAVDGTYTPNSNPFSIGGRFNYSKYFNGKIYEVLYFQHKLTSCQISQVEGYLYHKWNLENYIIDSHPFKNNPFGICNDIQFDIDENSSNGTIIGTLKGTYVDTPVTFSDWRIENSGLYPETFNLNNNGELTVQDNTYLDFETISALNIEVSAIANGIRVYGEIQININDVADGGTQKTHSELWGINGEKWDPRGRLPDFSFVGYKSGEEVYSYPTTTVNVTNFGAVPNDGISDVAAIKSAIASISSGIVYFPAGEYIIDDVIEINKSNIVLRGAGNNATTGTKFYFPNSGTDLGIAGSLSTGDKGYMILFNGVSSGSSYTVIEETKMGDRSLTLNSASSLNVGDIIGISYGGTHPTEGELWNHIFNDQNQDWQCSVSWSNGSSGLEMYHTIERIEGDIVTLREPIRLDLRLSWNPKIKLRTGNYIENCGVENIYMEHKYIPMPEHGEEPGYNSVSFERSFNCWVNNVTIEHADNGILFKTSGYGEMKNITFKGRAGHHGWKFAYSSHCLANFISFKNYEKWIHTFTSTHKANGNVISNLTGVAGIPISTDFHRNSPWETLITNVDNDWNYNSSGTYCAGPNAGKRTIYWNMGGDGFTSAPKWDDYQTTLVGDMHIPEQFYSEKGWHENVPNLEPANLYDAQLNRRLTLPSDPLFTGDALLGNRSNYWERDPARWEIKDGAYNLFFSETPSLSGDRLGEYTILNNTPGSNMLITVNAKTLENLTINLNTDIALIVNYQDDDNYYFLKISSDINESGLFKSQNGITTLLTPIYSKIQDGNFHSYSIERNGNSLITTIDGFTEDTTYDTTFSGGKVGFGSFNDAVSFNDVSIDSNTLSVDTIASKNNLLIYPNPTSNVLYIKGDGSELNMLFVFDMLGRDLTNKVMINKLDRTNLKIDLSNLPSGPYIIKTNNSANIVYKK